MTTTDGLSHTPADPAKRDFILILTGAMAAGGAAAALWPLVAEMDPTSDVIAKGSPITVDISKVEPGQQITVLWQSKPIFIVNRTPAALRRLTDPSVLDRLRDPNSKSRQQPVYAQNWSRSIKPEYLVLIGICTHLGCIPNYRPSPGSVDPQWPGGWFCPCHGSRYDLAGRVFKSVPAPLNMPVPPYDYANDTQIVLGKNPSGGQFAMSDIDTM